MQLRFHSPYRHWFKGFLIEVCVLAAFVLIVVAVAVAAALAFG